MSTADDLQDEWRDAQDATAAFAAELGEEAHTEADDRLARHLNGALPDSERATGVDEFRVDNDVKAQWALRKLKAATDELHRLQAAAGREYDRVTGWLNEASTRPQGRIEWFEAMLVDYRRRLEVDNPELPKTYRLPSGDLTRRAGSTKVDVYDLDAFVAWAADNCPEALKVTPLVSAIKFNQRFRPAVDDLASRGAAASSPLATEDGEIVPGVQYVVGADTYSVKPR